MSRRVQNNKKIEARATFCRVCKDSGLPVQVCESHNTKDFRGIVVCPTVKNNTCPKCYKKGHFAKYCTVTQKSKERSLGFEVTAPPVEKKPDEEKRALPSGRFAALEESSEEEEPPANVTIRVKPTARKFKSWADVESDDEEW
jgi:Nanos RNA binding domain